MPEVPKGEYLQYGGLALIEAIMMRSPRYYSVACRAPNGEIIVKTEEVEKTWIGRQEWLKKPFLRGTLALLDAMVFGNRCMKYAASVQLDPALQAPEELTVEEKEKNPDPEAQRRLLEEKERKLTEDHAKLKEQGDKAIAITVIVSLVFGFLLFNALPNYLAENSKKLGVTNPTILNVITETIKFTFLIGYLYLISQLKEIKEVFKYHGAEHKAINALEANQPIDLEHCQAQTRLHPRCGTSFAVIVFLVGFIIFTFVPRYPFGKSLGSVFLDVPVRLVIEILVLPFIAGIAYELLRFAGKHRDDAGIMFMFKPGLWTQLITTKEPETKHVEVAIAALTAVMEKEANHAVKNEAEAQTSLGLAPE